MWSGKNAAAVAAATLTLSFAGVSRAQSATPLDTLSLEPADGTFLATPSPWVTDGVTPSFALLFSY